MKEKPPLKAPEPAELATWAFDYRHGCHLTPEIISERFERAKLIPDEIERNILMQNLRESMKIASSSTTDEQPKQQEKPRVAAAAKGEAPPSW